MIRAARCSRCGAIRVRAKRPLDEATFDGAIALTRYSYDPRRPVRSTWDVEVIRAGESITLCDGHVIEERDEDDVADVGRELAPEDRIVLAPDGRASLVRRVIAVTVGSLAVANGLADALRDAIDTVAELAEIDGPRLARERDRLAPIKHPTLSQWAVRVRPRFRVLATDRAEDVLVALGTPFWRTDLATTRTRYAQMRNRLATAEDLDDTWGA